MNPNTPGRFVALAAFVVLATSGCAVVAPRASEPSAPTTVVEPSSSTAPISSSTPAIDSTGSSDLGPEWPWKFSSDLGSSNLLAAGDKDQLSWETGENNSYWIPVAEIIGFEFLLNQFDRHVVDERTYGTDWESIQDNLDSGVVIDDDNFSVNQLEHPYSGAMYYTFARSSGLNFWVSTGYAIGGSALWEIAGETTPPSVNDLIATGIGGSFLGESLFRIAEAWRNGGGESPGFFRELGAAIVCPPSAFNRLAFGDRFDTRYNSHDPATFSRFIVGGAETVHVSDDRDESKNHESEAKVALVVDYGLPGKGGYDYDRPFDQFHFEVAGGSGDNSVIDTLLARGLLFGSKYKWGSDSRGVWGLYGTFDYFAEPLFRVSSTALLVGSTAQWWLGDSVALQGSLFGGCGFGAAGAVADDELDRDYHYGITPQGNAGLRCIFGDVAMLEVTGAEYYVSGSGSDDSSSDENILRGMSSLTVRVYGHHALGIGFEVAERDANFKDIDNRHEGIAIASVFYTYLSDTHFGVVDWNH